MIEQNHNIQALPGAGARKSIVTLYKSTKSMQPGTITLLLKEGETLETLNFENLEKSIATTKGGEITIYGFQFATVLVAEFLVNGKQITLSKEIEKEQAFYYVDAKIVDRSQLLTYCNNDMRALSERFPVGPDYVQTVAGILPFHKETHRLLERVKNATA